MMMMITMQGNAMTMMVKLYEGNDDDDDVDDDEVAWGEGVANIIIPRRGADTNRVEAAATQPGAIDISQRVGSYEGPTPCIRKTSCIVQHL